MVSGPFKFDQGTDDFLEGPVRTSSAPLDIIKMLSRDTTEKSTRLSTVMDRSVVPEINAQTCKEVKEG